MAGYHVCSKKLLELWVLETLKRSGIFRAIQLFYRHVRTVFIINNSLLINFILAGVTSFMVVTTPFVLSVIFLLSFQNVPCLGRKNKIPAINTVNSAVVLLFENICRPDSLCFIILSGFNITYKHSFNFLMRKDFIIGLSVFIAGLCSIFEYW
jgi:hypothetical protein